jgi:hypothetical protein
MQNGPMRKLSNDHTFVRDFPHVVYISIPCDIFLFSRVLTNKFTKLSFDSQ